MIYHTNEFLLPHKLTNIQHQVLVGGLLGDFSISKAKSSRYPRMKIDRQALDKPYIDWEYNIFSDLCKSGVREFSRFDKRYNKWHDYVSFRTRAVPAFLDYYNKWYINGKRQVPEDIEFTPLILAIWFADDGCIINKQGDLLTLKLSTESFGEHGANILSSKLSQRYNQSFPIYRKKKDKDQFFIKTSTCSAQAFLKEVEPYVIEIGMNRKYNIWKDIDLNHKPIIGTKPRDNFELFEFFLESKNGFTVNEINNVFKNLNLSVAGYLRTYHKKGLFLRETDYNTFSNVYRYYLTESGREYFFERLKNDE